MAGRRKACASAMLKGPRDDQACRQWPDTIVDDLMLADGSALPPGVMKRLCSHVNRGLHMSSAYSGIAGDVMGATFVVECLINRGLLPAPLSDRLCFMDASDYDLSCQKALHSFREPVGPRHIFGDLNHRLPAHTQELLDSVAPTKTCQKENYDLQWQAMCAVLDAEPGLFSDGCKSECFRHKGLCHLYGWQQGLEGKLTIHWAGTTCIDFSSMGHSRGAFGPHSRTFAIWIRERRRRLEILIFQECTVHFPQDLIQAELDDLYQVTLRKECVGVSWDRRA